MKNSSDCFDNRWIFLDSSFNLVEYVLCGSHFSQMPLKNWENQPFSGLNTYLMEDTQKERKPQISQPVGETIQNAREGSCGSSGRKQIPDWLIGKIASGSSFWMSIFGVTIHDIPVGFFPQENRCLRRKFTC
jgi:hypothetical protein